MLHLTQRTRVAIFGALLVSASAVAVAEGPEDAGSGMRVYAYTLKHQPAHEALALIRPLLTARGTVEVQPGGNTLVIREARSALARLTRVLAEFDHPPEELRFDIRIVRAGPRRSVISPPEPDSGPLPENLAGRLRELLRYDDYRVLAEAGITSQEGEEVTYDLGGTYSVSFRSGTVMAGQRVKLEGFRIVKHAENATNKTRQLKPRELFHATLNLWLGRPFNLVLAQDESRQEALMVAISCRRENSARRDGGARRDEGAPSEHSEHSQPSQPGQHRPGQR